METKSLYDCKIGKYYVIADVLIENKKLLKHLNDLFIIKGEKIKIMHKSYGNKSFVINVLDINYAIDNKVCQKVLVYDD